MNLVLTHAHQSRSSASSIGFTGILASERSFQTTSIAEALHESRTTFRYQRTAIEMGQISPDDELGVAFEGNHYRQTERALEQLCTHLGLPRSFVAEIPLDLLTTNIDRLKTLHEETLVVVHDAGVIYGFVDPGKWTRSHRAVKRPHYAPVSNLETLRLIRDFRMPADVRVILSDSGIEVHVIDSDKALEPQVGDVTRLGISISNSETGGRSLCARGFTLRLVCTNGATVPDELGLVTFNTDWRVSLDRRLERFANDLRRFMPSAGHLRAGYDRMIAEQLSDQQFYNLHRQARYIYRGHHHGESIADLVLGVDPDERQRIVGEVRERQTAIRNGATRRLGAPQPTNVLAWDAFNSITAHARDETHTRRVALERLGGDVIRLYLDSRQN